MYRAYDSADSVWHIRISIIMNHSELVSPVLHCTFRTCCKIHLVRTVILFFSSALVCVIWCTITIWPGTHHPHVTWARDVTRAVGMWEAIWHWILWRRFTLLSLCLRHVISHGALVGSRASTPLIVYFCCRTQFVRREATWPHVSRNVCDTEIWEACWHVSRPELHVRSRDISRVTEVWICAVEFNVKSPLTSQLHA
jgi:hypothetical protein